MDNGGFRYPFIQTTSTRAPGRWTRNEMLGRIARRGQVTDVWPTAQDASYSSVSLLCHFEEMVANQDGTNSACIKVQQGNCDLRMGDAAGGDIFAGLTTGQSKWGGKSFFSNSNVALRCSTSGNGFDFGTGDFTIEFWLRLTDNSGSQNIIDMRPSTGTGGNYPVIYLNSNTLRYYAGSNRITGGTTVTTNTWHHVAVSKNSGSTILYLDGAQEGSTYADSLTYASSVASIYIMGDTNGVSFGDFTKGYMDDLRITKGVGRYSGASLTVPTAPFPDY